MESSSNRFADGEDLSVDNCDLKQLMADCEKWSHKNDLQLLSHLKQMSNNLINKSEDTNHSIDSLVFETKMHCVKVDNVINEFQMLANSQFVENRVYDEEMEDIITNGHNLQNEESVNNKCKEEEIMTKIKVSLNIGLDFLNQRFDCVSNKVSQNDSDDENDDILEGLISNSARDEYSQRLLPYIIGSDDFIKDNYVGLSCVEESPAIDLKTRIDNSVSVSDQSLDSRSNTFVPNITNTNNYIHDMNDSEDESNDLFGTIPKASHETNDISNTQESDDLFGTVTNDNLQNNDNVSNNEESDSEPFVSEDKEISKPVEQSNQWKPSMPSFHDELSAVLTGKRPQVPQMDKKEDTKQESIVSNNQMQNPQNFESESSDENDSIFNVTKTKPKIANKQKTNFSNLFGEELNEESLFAPNSQKQTFDKQISQVLPNSNNQKTLVKSASNLFDDDYDEEDLFGAISKKITKPSKTVRNENPENKEISNNFIQSVSSNDKKKSLVSKSSLFSDDEEEDDLFGAISSKSKQIKVQNSDAFEPVVKPTVTSTKASKPTDSLIGELSSALKKKKQLFQSDGEESDSDSDDNFRVKSDFKFKSENSSENVVEKQTNPLNASEIEEKNEMLFSEDNTFTEKITYDIPKDEMSFSKPLNVSNPANNDFYSEEQTLTLPNDGLKHRAALGAQRNRRPPTKKLLKMTPITDFNPNSETKAEIIPNVDKKSPPMAAIRTIKTTVTNLMSDELEENVNENNSNSSIDTTFKSMSTLVKSPSTEEDDIFPTQINSSKNQNISKIFEKSENPSIPLFDDSGDNEDTLFSSNKAIKNNVSKSAVHSKGLFDTSDSEDDNFFSNKSSNVISNIIKPSNSEIFTDVSSTDSSLSNKSDLKIGNSKPAVSLFSESDEDDLFSAVTKTKTIDKIPEKQPINRTEDRNEKLEKSPEKKSNSLFSDNEEENTDLFAKKEIKETKPKTNAKPLFDLEDDDDEDIFTPKTSITKTAISSKKKPRKESQSSDLFDDPLFASRS